MPSANQYQAQEQNELQIQNPITMIELLWHSLNYTLEQYKDVELIGVTWVNDFQFIINLNKFSNYISMNNDTVITELKRCGFLNIGMPSKEIFNDVEVSPSKEWTLYMRDGFTPNCEEEFVNEISSNY